MSITHNHASNVTPGLLLVPCLYRMFLINWLQSLFLLQVPPTVPPWTFAVWTWLTSAPKSSVWEHLTTSWTSTYPHTATRPWQPCLLAAVPHHPHPTPVTWPPSPPPPGPLPTGSEQPIALPADGYRTWAQAAVPSSPRTPLAAAAPACTRHPCRTPCMPPPTCRALPLAAFTPTRPCNRAHPVRTMSSMTVPPSPSNVRTLSTRSPVSSTPLMTCASSTSLCLPTWEWTTVVPRPAVASLNITRAACTVPHPTNVWQPDSDLCTRASPTPRCQCLPSTPMDNGSDMTGSRPGSKAVFIDWFSSGYIHTTLLAIPRTLQPLVICYYPPQTAVLGENFEGVVHGSKTKN